MDSAEWHLLQSLQNSARSPLMVKAAFEKDKYEIKVTDLIQVWSESLDKSSIISRAHRLDCSIDPAEDASQLFVFLQKIEAALLGKEGTQITAMLDEVENCITLSLSSDLPKPLKPLGWSIYLRRLPAEAIRSEVVLPLMYGSFIRGKQLTQLETFLEDKDSAIGKFADKVEGVGVDLSSLFLHAGAARSGKKNITREQLFKHIRGLASFDKETWKDEWRSDSRATPTFVEIAHQSFSAGRATPVQSLLDNIQRPNARKGADIAPAGIDHASQSSMTLEEAQSQEFQTAAPSPSATRRRLHRPETEPGQADNQLEAKISYEQQTAEVDDDETTEDGDDDADDDSKDLINAPRNSTPDGMDSTDESLAQGSEVSAENQATGARPGRKLGQIGGKRTQPEDQSANEDKQSAITNDNREEEEAALDSENIPATPKRKKIGVIGGRSTTATGGPSDGVTKQEHHEDTTTETTNSTTRDQGETAANQTNVEQTSENPLKPDGGDTGKITTKSASPEAEEDVQEKANRKRQELKRDLETRNKQTAKKKRKF